MAVQKLIARKFEELQKREEAENKVEKLKDRTHRLYEKGIQHVYANYEAGSYQIGTPGGTVMIKGRNVECSEYLDSYNIFSAYGRILDSPLTAQQVDAKATADNPGLSSDLDAADTANGFRKFFDMKNDMAKVQQTIARMYRLSGRCVSRSYTEANQARWGTNPDGTPRKMETVKIYGSLESKVPVFAQTKSECGYVFLYEDKDVLKLKWEMRDYPEIADKIKGGEAGQGEPDYTRSLRMNVTRAQAGRFFAEGGSGANITTCVYGYLRPEVFSDCTDAYDPGKDEDPYAAEGMTGYDRITEQFPEGLMATYMGKTFAGAVPVAIEDEIEISVPRVQDSLSGGATMEPAVVIQDTFNDYMNAQRQFYETGWPSLWMQASDADYDAMLAQRSEPNAIRQIKSDNPAGTPVEALFYKEPDPVISPTLVEATEALRGQLPEFILGALPALQGAAGDDNPTASGQAMDRAQALGQQGPTWSNMQKHIATIYDQVSALGSKNPDHGDEISLADDDGGPTTSIKMPKLTGGSYAFGYNSESGIPESMGAKRSNLLQLLPLIAPTPIGQELMKSPRTWETILTQFGMKDDFTLNPAEAYRKQMREFDKLLEQTPVIDQAATAAAMIQHAADNLPGMVTGGQPSPAPQPVLKSSIDVEPQDFHNWESMACAEWLSSGACNRELQFGGPKGIGNPLGVQNIRLHMAQHDQFIAQQAQAQVASMAAMMPQKMPQAPGKSGAHAPEANSQVQKIAAPPGTPGAPGM